ncbi:MAG: glycosyltransferase [Candidatus Bathyarchaeia archaeon]
MEPSRKTVGVNRPSENVEVSVLLPMHNEAKNIERCVAEVERTVKSFFHSYEIIIAEDGSTDGTDVIGARLAEKNPKLKFLHSPTRLGKGKAIKRAISVARGEVVVFMDADLATDLGCLPKIVEIVQRRGGMAIGSRYVHGACVERPLSRKIFSAAYNLLVRILFRDGILDHQCGFKGLTYELAQELCKKCASDGLFLDTEMIVQAKKLGYEVAEVAVNWRETRGKGESKVKLFKDALKIGMELLKFKLRSYIENKTKSQWRNASNGQNQVC